MRMTWRVVAALAGALLWGACNKEQAPAPAPAAKPQPAMVEEPSQPAAEPQPEEAPTEEAQAAPVDEGPPPEFKIGQTRDELMDLFGTCAERRVFIPPRQGALYVEVFQAKDDEHCRKRLGERQFTIRGGELYQITPGLIPPEKPRGKPDEKPRGG